MSCRYVLKALDGLIYSGKLEREDNDYLVLEDVKVLHESGKEFNLVYNCSCENPKVKFNKRNIIWYYRTV